MSFELKSHQSHHKTMRLKLYIFLALLSFSSATLAKEFQLKGSFKLDSSSKRPVAFTLSWEEDKNLMKGIYQDDYFTKEGKVRGIKSNTGRTFTVTFPENKKGVTSLTLLSSQAGTTLSGTTIPVSIITRDQLGNPLTNAEINSQFAEISPRVAQKQEETPCREGFGALAGHCGVYEGLITEEVDRGNQCNLLFADAIRLELNSMGDMTLYLGEVNEVASVPIHNIGRIPSNPESTAIDVLSRSCRPLPGTTFPGDNCKRLHLIGRFTTEDVTRHFTGVYSIIDELTNNTCRYSISLDRGN